MIENYVYACGGEYPNNDHPVQFNFRLVKPSGATALPYVSHSEPDARKLHNLCKHHSHLYRFRLDTGEGTLVTLGEPRTDHALQGTCVKAPKEVTLTHEAHIELLGAVVHTK